MNRIKTHFAIVFLIFVLGLFCVTQGAKAQQTPLLMAKIVSIQGQAEVQRSGQTGWTAVAFETPCYVGDVLRVLDHGRVALRLANDSILRLDANTTIKFSGIEQKRSFLINLVQGISHLFSRYPRSLKILTPFVNGTVEGTEFYVRVSDTETVMTLFEGRIDLANDKGRLSLKPGDSAVAAMGQEPVAKLVAAPRDAVMWALYYPPVVDYRDGMFSASAGTWQEPLRRSVAHYRKGELSPAFDALAQVPVDVSTENVLLYRAGLLLTVGRIDAAQQNIDRVLSGNPTSGRALTLQAVVAAVNNETDKATELAQRAIDFAPKLAAPYVAQSYARQATFDIPGALQSLQMAVAVDPENGLAWARLSELYLSTGDTTRATSAAAKAATLQPDLSRTQTVTGFAHLSRIRIDDAMAAFERALQLDQAAPLPRLGLGLAMIRSGKSAEGRAQIELAVALDPNNALMRSYLGKAYLEEKRPEKAKTQLELAKQLDQLDPTPWFYDALRQQGANQPIAALKGIQESIRLNDNRAIYRSRLLLDEDRAVRSAGLARIYSDLGFQQLALNEGWKSLHTDPSNHSAHRFLADAYVVLPRHEIARASEQLQSQMLQPLSINPVQPQLPEDVLFLPYGIGPTTPSFNEYTPLFERNRLALQASATIASHSTWGDELVLSGLYDRFSFSAGQFHYESDGYRENMDTTQDIFNAFGQMMVSPSTSIQAEFRRKTIDEGDTNIRFDPDAFEPTRRKNDEIHSYRLGLRQDIGAQNKLLVSVIYQDGEFKGEQTGFGVIIDELGTLAEFSWLHNAERWHLIAGGGIFEADREEAVTLVTPFFTSNEVTESVVRHSNAYLYLLLHFPEDIVWTLGASYDDFKNDTVETDELNPKLGVTWQMLPRTTLRAAAFKGLKRQLISSQTLEPTNVAGFNQFFDDSNGAESWRYGIGIDQVIFSSLYAGVEYSQRDLEIPFEDIPMPPAPPEAMLKYADWSEQFLRSYLFWTPHPMLAVSAEPQYEMLERDEMMFGEEGFVKLETVRLPLGLKVFHPSGMRVALGGTYVHQQGDFIDFMGEVVADEDRFWVFDGAVGYQLPQRRGLVSVEVRNLFDKSFKYLEAGTVGDPFWPERRVIARVSLAF